MIINVILACIWGLIYGSFLNVLLWRLPEQRGINGRSHCRSCNHQLAWYDLIPVLSFAILKGKCRYCHDRIHVRYPLVEIGVAVTLGLFFAIQAPTLSFGAILSVFALLVMVSLFFFDLFYFILPDAILFPSIIIFAVYDTLIIKDPLQFILTGFLGAGFFAILYGVSRGSKLGFGDVKLALLLGFIFGYPLGLFSIILGVWLAAGTALVLLAVKKVGLRDAIPLGAFLALAAIISIIFHYEALLPIIFFR